MAINPTPEHVSQRSEGENLMGDSLGTISVETSKAALSSFLREKGYSIDGFDQTGFTKPFSRAETEKARDLFVANLRAHNVEFSEETVWHSGKIDQAIVITPLSHSKEKQVSSLNRLASRIDAKMPDTKLFFDLSGKNYIGSLASCGGQSLCLPLSAAIDPDRVIHPSDPSLLHEIHHLARWQYQLKVGDTPYSVDMYDQSFENIDPILSSYQCDEFRGGRYNVKHALRRVNRLEKNNQSNSQEYCVAQTDIIKHLLGMQKLAQHTIETISKLASGLEQNEVLVALDPFPKGMGCQIWLELKAEPKKGLTFISHAENIPEAKMTVENYFTNLYTLASEIDSLVSTFIVEMNESGFVKHFADLYEKNILIPPHPFQERLKVHARNILETFQADDYDMSNLAVEKSRDFEIGAYLDFVQWSPNNGYCPFGLRAAIADSKA